MNFCKVVRPVVCLGLLIMAIGTVVYGFDYANCDLLIDVDHGTYGRVIVDLGSISNYTAVPSGNTIIVTNFCPCVFTNYLLANYGGIHGDFSLMAASGYTSSIPAIWTTGPTNIWPLTIHAPRFQIICNKINGMGSTIETVDAAYFSPPLLYDAHTNNVHIWNGLESGISNPSNLWNNVSFLTKTPLPGSAGFYQLIATNDPLPLSVKVGKFKFDTNGVLTFTAGSF